MAEGEAHQDLGGKRSKRRECHIDNEDGTGYDQSKQDIYDQGCREQGFLGTKTENQTRAEGRNKMAVSRTTDQH